MLGLVNHSKATERQKSESFMLSQHPFANLRRMDGGGAQGEQQ